MWGKCLSFLWRQHQHPQPRRPVRNALMIAWLAQLHAHVNKKHKNMELRQRGQWRGFWGLLRIPTFFRCARISSTHPCTSVSRLVRQTLRFPRHINCALEEYFRVQSKQWVEQICRHWQWVKTCPLFCFPLICYGRGKIKRVTEFFR